MFELKLDTASLNDKSDPSIQERIDAMLPRVANELAMAAFAHLKKQAAEKLHSSRRQYVENLTVYPTGDGTWVVELLKPAHWIEEGRPEGSMVDDLLNGPGQAKIGKDGTKYKVIPFHHNQPPTNMTPAQHNLRNVIQKVFKENGIEWGQPSQIAERDRAGGFVDGGSMANRDTYGPSLTPAQRRLSTTLERKLNIMDKPLKTHEGVGQGQGPVGAPIQGPTGIPHLQGIRVYQNEIKATSGKLVTQRDVMTFRTVTEKHKEEGRWKHPGFEAKRFFDPTYQYIKNQWESEIKPQIEAQLKGAE